MKLRNILSKLEYVQWDRYTELQNENLETIYRLYGWINRKNDKYKDFIVIEYNTDTKKYSLISTSSAKYSHQITKDLDIQTHTECKRIQDLYPQLDNKIEIEKQE